MTSKQTKLFLVALIAILPAAPPLVYARDNPFQIGSDANPFEFGPSSATANGDR